MIFAHFVRASCLLLACLLLAKPVRSTLDTKEGYKTKTGSTSSVTLTLTWAEWLRAAVHRWWSAAPACSAHCSPLHSRSAFPLEIKMSSSIATSAQSAMLGFWHIYQFRDLHMEEQYRRHYQPSAIRAAQVWCVFHMLYDTLTPLGYWSRQFTLGFYMSFVANFVLALGCLVLLWLAPKRVIPITSVTLVLMTLLAGWSVITHTEAMVADSQKTLDEVFGAVESHPAALRQLDAYVAENQSIGLVNAQISLTIPALLLLLYLGLYRSTFCASILMPVGFTCMVCLGPDVAKGPAVVRGAGCCLASLFLIGLLARGSWLRRCSFFSERHFEAELRTAVDASRKADRVLNHKLKNVMADAAGDIDLFIETAAGAVPAPDPRVSRELQQAVTSLRRGMRMCQHRQAYMKLAAEQYALALQPVGLRSFAGQLTAGRQLGAVTEDTTVLIDPVLCDLILDNIINNAFVHGRTPDPDIRVSAATDVVDAAEGQARLVFTVSNRANPARPRVTPDYLDDVLSGRLQSHGPATSAMSDRIGLQHAFMAAKAHGMTLRLTESAQRVTARLEGVVQLCAPPRPAEHDCDGDQVQGAWPHDLTICCIDDSAPARRLLLHNLTAWAQTSRVRLYGQNESEAAAFVEDTLREGDIAILDQHLEYGGEANLLGTDLVRQLVARGFAGLICMRSANMTEEDVALYRAAGAHCTFGKDGLVKDMILAMKLQYVRRMVPREPARAVPSSASFTSVSSASRSSYSRSTTQAFDHPVDHAALAALSAR